MSVPTTITANAPQSLQAFQVTKVGPMDTKTNQRVITLANKSEVVLSQKQTTGFLPSIGDYYVIPSEGHPYCIARNIFLQNYTI
jgi:hypothetical protein